MRPLNWNLDLGSLAHISWGIAGGILNPWLFSIVFLVFQLMDWFSGSEPWEETEWDVIEFCIGLLTGLIIALIIPVWR